MIEIFIFEFVLKVFFLARISIAFNSASFNLLTGKRRVTNLCEVKLNTSEVLWRTKAVRMNSKIPSKIPLTQRYHECLRVSAHQHII